MTNRLTINDAQVAQILATMTEHLGRMTDPNYSKQLRADLLTLPDEVQAMQAAAQETISQANALRADVYRCEVEANERVNQRERAVALREVTMEQINARIAEADSKETSNKKGMEELKKAADKLTADQQKHEVAKTEVENTRKKNEQRQAALDAFEKTLNEKAESNRVEKAKIKELGQQLHGVIGEKLSGLIKEL